jgi:CubicO group peptidase (beta-lactamase class C family)
MRNLFISIILFLAINSFAQVNNTYLKQYIDSCRSEWLIPGMSVAIVKDGKTEFIEGFGVREYGKNDAVTPQTMFGIASLSKAFTSAAIAKLCDEGKIQMDDKVIKHLPYFKMYNPWVTSEITVRDLLCHRSGLTTFSGDLLWHSTIYSREDIIKRIQYLKPSFGFRDGYGYSNLLFLTAGEIIPVVSGKSYDDYIKESFFVPLGMKNTNTSIKYMKGASEKSLAGAYENIAKPHYIKNGKTTPIKYISWDNITPAGGINSTAEEMTYWIKMLLNNGKFNGNLVLTENALNTVWTAHNNQAISKFDKYLFPSMNFHSYGLGWDMFTFHGRKVICHSGGLDGMVLQLCIVPEENLGFVILTNSSNYLPYALMYKILDEYFGTKGMDYPRYLLSLSKRYEENEAKAVIEEEKNRDKTSKPSLTLQKYCGKYCCDLYGCATISLKNNTLQLVFDPAPEFQSELPHWQYNTFSVEFKEFPSLPKGKVNFIIDQEGNVNDFTIDVPNPDFDFREMEFKRFKENAH